MSGSQYVKYGAFSVLMLMLLGVIMLSTIEDNQKLVLAQITPAPGKFVTDESSPNGSYDTDNDDGDGGFTGSSGSDNDDDEQSKILTGQDGTIEEETNDGQGAGEEQGTNDEGTTSTQEETNDGQGTTSIEQVGTTDEQKQNDNNAEDSTSIEPDGITVEEETNDGKGTADEQDTNEQSPTSTEPDGTTGGDTTKDYQLANSLLAMRDQIDQVLALLK
jgi:hypothetical protein